MFHTHKSVCSIERAVAISANQPGAPTVLPTLLHFPETKWTYIRICVIHSITSASGAALLGFIDLGDGRAAIATVPHRSSSHSVFFITSLFVRCPFSRRRAAARIWPPCGSSWFDLALDRVQNLWPRKEMAVRPLSLHMDVRPETAARIGILTLGHCLAYSGHRSRSIRRCSGGAGECQYNHRHLFAETGRRSYTRA